MPPPWRHQRSVPHESPHSPPCKHRRRGLGRSRVVTLRRASSSIWQSNGLLIRRFGVRVPGGPPHLTCCDSQVCAHVNLAWGEFGANRFQTPSVRTSAAGECPRPSAPGPRGSSASIVGSMAKRERVDPAASGMNRMPLGPGTSLREPLPEAVPQPLLKTSRRGIEKSICIRLGLRRAIEDRLLELFWGEVPVLFDVVGDHLGSYVDDSFPRYPEVSVARRHPRSVGLTQLACMPAAETPRVECECGDRSQPFENRLVYRPARKWHVLPEPSNRECFLILTSAVSARCEVSEPGHPW